MTDTTKITNVISNKTFEPGGTQVEIARNHATNPGFEQAAGTIVIGRNLILNPRLAMIGKVPGQPGYTIPGANTLVQTDDGASPGRKAVKIVPNGVSHDSRIRFAGSNTSLKGQGVIFTPGMWYSVTVRVVVPAVLNSLGPTGNTILNMRAIWNNIGGWTGATTVQTTYPNVPGEYSLNLTFQLPSNAIWCELRLYNGSKQPEDVVIVKDLVLVDGDTESSVRYKAGFGYFDGQTSPYPDAVPSWSSSANGSISVLSVSGVSGVSDQNSPDRGVVCQSSMWSAHGVSSIRLLGSVNNYTDTFIQFNSEWFGGMGSVSGKWLGIKAVVRLDQPATGATNSLARSVTVKLENTTAMINVSDTPYPNTAGEHVIRGVFQIPPGESLSFYRVYLGHAYGSFWIDDMLTVSGDSEEEVRKKLSYGYFGGAISSDPDLVSSFVGTTNNSETVLRAPSITGIAPTSNLVAVSSSQNLGSGDKSLRLIRKGGGNASAALDIPASHVDEGSFFSTVAQGTSESGVSVDGPEVTSSGLGRRGVSWTEELDPPQKAVFHHSTSSWDDVYFTDPVLVDDSDYTGVYFDGDTGPFIYHSQMVTPTWDGNSSSFEYYDVSEVIWDEHGKKIYEVGVDHGVLYVPDQSGAYVGGVPWNGLVSITESPSGAEVTKSYADNLPYLTMVSAEEFTATVEAYTYPGIFEECDGTAEPTPGVLVAQQPRRPFGLVYRTKVGDDINSMNAGYKLHLVYNAMAAPTEKAYASVNDSPEPTTFSWELSTTSVAVNNELTPTSLITIDSRRVNAVKLTELEDVLFGRDPDNNTPPTLPSPADVISMLE